MKAAMEDVKNFIDTSVLSEEEMNDELVKGFLDVAAGRTVAAEKVFENIRNSIQG